MNLFRRGIFWLLLLSGTIVLGLLTKVGWVYQSFRVNCAGVETAKSFWTPSQGPVAPVWRSLASRFPQNEAADRNLRRQNVLEGNLEVMRLPVPRDPFARFWTGYSLWQLGEREQSVIALEDVPGVAFFFGENGRESAKAELWEEAVPWLEMAIRLDPYQGDYQCWLARVYRSMGQLDSALLEARLATESTMFVEDSLRFSCALMAGRLLVDQGQWVEATGYLELAARLRPDNSQPLIELGNAQFLMERDAKAREYYYRALSVNPTSSETWIGLGDVQRQVGDLRMAAFAYLCAGLFDPDYDASNDSSSMLPER